MFHVKPTYFVFKPRFNQELVLEHYPVFTEKSAQTEEKTCSSESLDNTGVLNAKTLKKGIFRSFSMKWKLFGTLLLLNSICFGQLEPVAIGQWKIHMTTREALDITKASDQKFYAAFRNGVYFYDNSDGSHEILSKTNGLISTGVSQIEYFAPTNTVIVGYSDGNLDLILEDGGIYNMGDIKRSNIVGDKSIIDLVVYGNYVYICTGFGIVVLDPSRKEIKDTYIFGNGGANIKVNGVCFDGTKVYAATEEGLYSALLSDPFLANYTSWTKDNSINPAAVNGPFSNIAFHSGKLFVSRKIDGNNNDSTYFFDGAWNVFSQALNNDVRNLKSIGDKLLIIGNGTLAMYDQNMTVFKDMSAYTFDYIDAVDADYNSSDNQLYIADLRHGVTRGVNTWNNGKVSGKSPYSNGSAHVDVHDGTIVLAHDGFLGVNGLNAYSRSVMSAAYEDEWKYFNPTSESSWMHNDSVFDGVAVKIDPEDKNHWFLGTYSNKGIFEFQDGEIVAVYDETNSAIGNAGIQGYNSIAAMDIDEDGNLWAINSKSVTPLVVKTPEGNWYQPNIGVSMNNRNLYDVMADSEGLVWVAAPTGNSVGGLLVYNHNGTIDDDSDDAYFLLTSGAGSGDLPSQDVKCVAEDLDGEIWIGTANGLGIIYDPSGIFTGNMQDAQQILIEQDGNIQILFENEILLDIEVDGANRKWFATEGSGVFLMSEDGQEQILHLTKENSPLLSDIVFDVAVDDVTGDVYFATSEGLVSLRYTATGSQNAYQDVLAYPNPVRNDYDGIVAVKGLSRDSDFKVTDVSGALVYHGISEGGQAIWDLKDLKGNRVSTGVYLIYCNSESGNRDAVAKLLVIN